MKTLNLHCDYIKFNALKKALKNVDDIAPGQALEGESRECLVVLMAVEKGDDSSVSQKIVSDIKNIASQVKVDNVVLYPYAHLSSNLGSPKLAVKIMNEVASSLGEYTLVRAPFGYYKSFELKVKGHPLSELSREITSTKISGDEVVEESLTIDERKQLLRQISRAKLDTSKLKGNDHRIIGSKMDLWSFHNVAPGMVFWHDKGLFLKNKLIDVWRDMQRVAGYKEISTPQIMDSKIWKVSGHWDKYKENNFVTAYEDRAFLAKPMNCPGGMMVYKSSPKSYKDLPLRVAEMGVVHRVELSGVLAGLFRVIQFTQDDAHLFCTKEQLEQEVLGVVDLIKKTYALFGLQFDHVELSTRPEKRIGEDKDWDFTEGTLEKILKKSKMKYKINAGDGAFYGPKIDFHVKDSLGRTWQCSTIQMDVSMPESFNLTYVDKEGNDQRPVMLHRVLYGSLERFIGIITEHLNGNFPLWCSPNQVMVMNMNEKVEGQAKIVFDKLHSEGFRVEGDFRNESMAKKARDAQVQHFNYLLTIGEKEVSENKVAVRKRDSKDIELLDLDVFIERLKGEIASKNL